MTEGKSGCASPNKSPCSLIWTARAHANALANPTCIKFLQIIKCVRDEKSLKQSSTYSVNLDF